MYKTLAVKCLNDVIITLAVKCLNDVIIRQTGEAAAVVVISEEGVDMEAGEEATEGEAVMGEVGGILYKLKL